jgi:hypothetical protein
MGKGGIGLGSECGGVEREEKRWQATALHRREWARTIKEHGSMMVTHVTNNLLVILMDVAGLTQWGSSWRRERVCGRGGIRKNCGNLWKTKTPCGKRRIGTRLNNTFENHLSDYRGGLNRSMQHSTRSQLAVVTKAESAC